MDHRDLVPVKVKMLQHHSRVWVGFVKCDVTCRMCVPSHLLGTCIVELMKRAKSAVFTLQAHTLSLKLQVYKHTFMNSKVGLL